ncbi:MAG: hypothetical protein J6S78_00160 [Lachnospiraceae bacterium]|nr:hypothetical protein [Lachnospiraceae bacterium]
MENDNYLDDLDRELAEYNRKATGAKLRPAEKDGGYDIGRYQFQLEAMRNGLQKLSTRAESYSKDIIAIDERKNAEKITILFDSILLAVCMGLFFLFGWLGLTGGIGGAVSFGVLCIGGAIGTCYFLLRLLNNVTAYLVKTKSGPHSNIVEENYIRHFAGEREYYLSCIGDINKRSNQIRRVIEAIEKKGHVSEATIEKARRLTEYTPPMNIYRDDKFAFREWVEYKLSHRKL